MINADLEKVILSAEEINSRILEIAEEINQHYQDMSDDHLLEIHNKVFPNRTKNPNYKVITKKS